jgi:HrpA-like RNA helicase
VPKTFFIIGILLNRLLCNAIPKEKKVALVLDEIHELTTNSVLLLALLKRNYRKLQFKVILMSATLKMDALVEYLSDFSVSELKVEGFSFGYDLHYLSEGTSNFLHSALEIIRTCVRDSLQAWDCFHCKRQNQFDVFQCCQCHSVRSSHILVFLPGIKEIQSLANELFEGLFCFSKQ